MKIIKANSLNSILRLTFKVLPYMLLLLFSINCYSQIGILTDTPDPSSALEIESTNKGLLIPRISLTGDLNSASPVSSPATGLLIFNSGSNQTMGFYYWNGSQWISTSFSDNDWSTTGNNSTSINTNFLGTSDNQDFAIRTNNLERIRIESDGQVIIGEPTPIADEDLFTVVGNTTQNFAINAYSPNGYGVFSSAGIIGLYGLVNNINGYSLWAKNNNASGYGAMIIGSNADPYTLNDHSTGLLSHGNDGAFCYGQSSSGIGIIAAGNGVSTISTINTGSGGAFTGYHGIFSISTNQSEGTGVIGIGNAGSFYLNSTGSGGAFSGNWTGASGWATQASNGSIGLYGSYIGSGSYDGVGVYGISNTTDNNRGYGVYGKGNRYGVFAEGDLGASGSKSFAIDHPLDPENKILKHYSVESPEVTNMYRGNVLLNENGEAQINLPDYFESININLSYLLAPIGERAPDLYVKTEVNENGSFIISGGNPGQKISWVIYANRNDPYMQQNKENQKAVLLKDDAQKGKYIMPELYNQPINKGMFYKDDNEITEQLQKHKVTKENSIENNKTTNK